MNENNVSDDSRRTFLKGATATGLAATGLGVFSGSAAAQQNIRELNISLNEQGGLLNVNVQNVNVLRNVNVQDVVVTVIGGDVDIIDDVDINIEDVEVNLLNIALLNDLDIDIEDVEVLNNILNDSVVQVAVAVLGQNDNIVAAGSDALNL